MLTDDVAIEETEQGETIETTHIVTVLVTVRRSASPGQIVDANGVVQADIAIDTLTGQNVRTRTTLVREAPGAEWRILDQATAGICARKSMTTRAHRRASRRHDPRSP
ncbi:MAG: hypothetical protein R2715_16740 [Ilumatobacteraceae bacterium]